MSASIDLSQFPDLPSEVVNAFAAVQFELSVERAARQHEQAVVAEKDAFISELKELIEKLESQVQDYRRTKLGLHEGSQSRDAVINWASDALKQGPVLVHGSAAPEDVKRAQEILGVARAGEIVEHALSALACALAPLPQTGRIIVAGGETSGAVVSALGVTALRIGAEIDPGVPWTMAIDAKGQPVITLGLKSGNFGSDDFFTKADASLKGRYE